MKFYVIFETVLGGFACIRGYAKLGDLANNSTNSEDIQRDLISEHRDEMIRFLTKGQFRFFPEVILSLDCNSSDEYRDLLYKNFDKSITMQNEKSKIDFTKKNNVINATIDLKSGIFIRIDGNHRLSAINDETKDLVTPFCIILSLQEDQIKNVSALFHNINYKQIPLTMEQNLKIIIEKKEIFDSDTLKDEDEFGWSYFLTRKVCETIDWDLIPLVNDLIKNGKYTFINNLLDFFIKNALIKKQDNEISKFKKLLSEINSFIDENDWAKEICNEEYLSALIYYKKINDGKLFKHFISWSEFNNIHKIQDISSNEIIKVFDNIANKIPKHVFLARWFPKETDSNFQAAKNRRDVIEEIVKAKGLDLIDLSKQDGAAYSIQDVIRTTIPTSDIVVIDITGNRPNVMIELGYALKHLTVDRLIIVKDKNSEAPFDISDIRRREISEANDLKGDFAKDIDEIISHATDWS